MCCISHSFQFIHGKDFQTYYQYEGFNVGGGGNNYNNLIYVDDTVLLAGNENDLSELSSKINKVGKQFGMKINVKKTKAMVVSKKTNSPKINIIS